MNITPEHAYLLAKEASAYTATMSASGDYTAEKETERELYFAIQRVLATASPKDAILALRVLEPKANLCADMITLPDGSEWEPNWHDSGCITGWYSLDYNLNH